MRGRGARRLRQAANPLANFSRDLRDLGRVESGYWAQY